MLAVLGGFRRELTPTWLSLACLLNGQRPPDLGSAFRTVHLGCGVGHTAAVVAAMHPRAEVWAWSGRPADVEATHRLGATAGLANLVVHERPGLPDDLGGALADLVLLDDVLTAAPEEQRARLVSAVGANLRPGGLACVTYKTTVGWSEIEPVQRIMRHVALRHTGHPDELVPSVLRLLDQLREGGARHFTERPAVARWLDTLRTMDAHQLAAEYLRDELHPLSHTQVAAAMSDVGCDYVGSAELGDGDVPPALVEQVATAASPVLREAFRDIATRPSTRLDLFRRGLNPLTPHALAGALDAIELVPLGAAEPAEQEPDDDRVAHIGWLVAAGCAHPAVIGGGDDDARATARALAEVLEAAGVDLVPAPVIGSALPADTDTRTLARVGAT